MGGSEMRSIALAATVLGLLWGRGSPVAGPRAAGVATVSHTTLRLVPETASLEPGRTLDLGLFFDVEPNWHIYWINPGDSGEPPAVKWNLPAGFQAGDLEWPAPERLVNGPLTDYGYRGRVMLIAPVRVPSEISGQNATLSADVRWLVCSNVCIPASASLSIDLPVQHNVPRPDGQARTLFQSTLRALPRPLPARWRASAEDEGDRFRIRLTTGAKVRQASFFPLDFNEVENAKPQDSTPLPAGVEVSVYKSDQLVKPLRQLRGIIVIDAGRAYEVTAAVKGR
jgi:DsbC/DsbD-like thiol-disulfide interchange protein